MILSLYNKYNKNKNPTRLFLISVLLLISCALSLSIPAMKVHPIPRRRSSNNISIQYLPRAQLSEAHALLGLAHKKLRRLPHVFSRVLELPFRSDADVLIEENPDCFRFVAETENIGVVRAHTVEIHPGVTKVVVRENGSAAELTLDELELDMWRFRLPDSTRPELARAVFLNGELIVTVPKIENQDGADMWTAAGNRLVLVQ